MEIFNLKGSALPTDPKIWTFINNKQISKGILSKFILTFLIFLGRWVGRSPLNSHPETVRRSTMCEATAVPAPAGRLLTLRDEDKTIIDY